MHTHSDLSDGSSESDGNILERDQPQQHHNVYICCTMEKYERASVNINLAPGIFTVRSMEHDQS